MPERWEREVERLRTLTPPRSTRSRIAEGSHGEGMPPAPRRGQRIVAAVVAFAVFGAAAVLIADAFRDRTPVTRAATDPAATVVVHLDSADGPSATLDYVGRTSQPQVGPYCWNGTQRCAETALTPFRDADFVQVPSGTPIMLVGDAELGEASATILRTNDPRDADVRIGAKNPIDSIGDGSGRDAGAYVLTVYAMWPQGGVSFYFPVEIVAGTSPTPSQSASVLTAVLEAPADGSMPGLVLTYAGRTKNVFAQDGRWPGVDAFPMPLLALDASIDPGTSFSIESDAEHVGGSLFIADRDQRETGESIPLDLTSGSATFPDSPGYFRLVLVGTWPRGEAGFNVGITIGTPPSDWPPSPSTATVPNVIGLEKHQAVSRLIDAGFEMVSVAVPAGQTGGVVTSQDPPPGSISETTTTIRLTVSASG